MLAPDAGERQKAGFLFGGASRLYPDTTPRPSSVRFHTYQESLASAAEILRQAKPDMVFHLASCVLVDHSPEDVDRMLRANIDLGTHLLEAMARTGRGNFINTGTFWQHDRTGGYDPVNLYAATKQAFEEILRYYCRAKGIRAVTLKLFDVYGPGDTRDKLFRHLERAVSSGQPLNMTPGRQLVDFVHIDDVVRAYLRAAQLVCCSSRTARGESYAVSSGRQTPLRDVVEIYRRACGKTVPVVWGGRPYRAREVMKPWKGKPLPGWKARVDLAEGIRDMLKANEGNHVIARRPKADEAVSPPTLQWRAISKE